jgi:hypothetical protein
MEGVAQQYFAGQRFFGDLRLDDRLYDTFDRMAQRPDQSLPKKLPSKAALYGGYRLLNHPDVSHEKILRAHRDSCLQSLSPADGVVLLLHDTTVLDYSGLDVEGLGQVGDGHGKGLYAHNTLAVRRDDRQIVGLANQILHKRGHAPRGESKAARLARPDRESRLWKDAVAALPAMPRGVKVIDISDRGSDILEYLDFEVQQGRTFIVRSQHNRKLEASQDDAAQRKLHAFLRSLEPMARYPAMVDATGIPRMMTLAWSAVSIVPPRQPRGEHGAEPLLLWGLIVREEKPLDPDDPIEWMLLTNQEIRDESEARQVVEDYSCRWMIEEYHKGMKTGCGIEELQLTTRHGLDNAIALLSVLAVHVLKLRCTARDEKLRNQPATVLEEPVKVRLAAKHVKHAEWRTLTVWSFYIAVAKLGGYMANPLKRPPGWQILWRGYVRLNDMAEGIRMLNEDV